jgi:hypothetical protein
MDDILFAIALIAFVGFGVALYIEEMRNFKRLKESY